MPVRSEQDGGVVTVTVTLDNPPRQFQDKHLNAELDDLLTRLVGCRIRRLARI